MTSTQIIAELKKAGSESAKKMYLKHGAKEPFFGTKIEDMKKIMKGIKEDRQQLALELFDSGIGDAQYMAGLMANGDEMSTKQLTEWVKKASWGMISEYSVPWVTCENEKAVELALKWIDDKNVLIACSGWNTLASVASTWADEKLDMGLFKKLLSRVEKDIHKAPNRVRYCMDTFVIVIGSYIKALNAEAAAIGKKIGDVEVDMNGTACKVPFAPDYIKKAVAKGSLTKKKKTAKC